MVGPVGYRELVGMSRRKRWNNTALALFAAAAVLTACAPGSAAPGATPVRIGYFPNITHAPAIAAVAEGFFSQELGTGAEVTTSTFKAGPDAVSALFSGAVDIAYMGPSPAINAFQKSDGDAVRIVAGSTSGGASLVVRPGVDSAADLRGRVVASPQLGNTQDVALRAWLNDQGLQADAQGGGDVSIRPQENAQTLQTFQSGDIDAAWVPEPWATRLVQEGGGKVLVDERALWPEGRFTTTVVVVRRQFLEEHPDLVERVLRAHMRAVDSVNADPAGAQTVVNDAIEQLTGKRLPDRVVQAAWKTMTFTPDPIAASLHKSAVDAHDAGLLDDTGVDGIFELGPLNAVLEAQGREPVADQ